MDVGERWKSVGDGDSSTYVRGWSVGVRVFVGGYTRTTHALLCSFPPKHFQFLQGAASGLRQQEGEACQQKTTASIAPARHCKFLVGGRCDESESELDAAEKGVSEARSQATHGARQQLGDHKAGHGAHAATVAHHEHHREHEGRHLRPQVFSSGGVVVSQYHHGPAGDE